MPIVPAQQVDSSCPPSGENSPEVPSSPAGAHVAAHTHNVDNDEAGVENITQVHLLLLFTCPVLQRKGKHYSPEDKGRFLTEAIIYLFFILSAHVRMFARTLPHFCGGHDSSKKHAGRIREDPVGFVVQTAAFYQGTVRYQPIDVVK